MTGSLSGEEIVHQTGTKLFKSLWTLTINMSHGSYWMLELGCGSSWKQGG